MENSVFMFYLFSGTILFFSVLTVTSRRILRAAVFLLFALVATSGIYFMMNYQFLAGVQLSLYAGGIVVLIIFSILLTHHISYKFERPPFLNLSLSLLVAITGAGLSIFTLVTFPFQKPESIPVSVNMQVIGRQLMGTGQNGYALPFEVISILLLAAMVAAIVIAKKGQGNRDKGRGTRD
jgi:NADH-quinone oxidoreductase subunit J